MRELREILEHVRALGRRPAPAALATIVRVQGSSYRREGARMLLEADGPATGVLSGGCLEADLAKAAAAASAEHAPRTVVYDLQAEEEAVWGFGLGCQGEVTLLVEPLDGDSLSRLERELEAVLEQRRELRVATVFAVEGEVGVRVGERVSLFLRDQGRGFIEGKDSGGLSSRPGGRERSGDGARGADGRSWSSVAVARLMALAPGEARAVRLELAGASGAGAVSLLAESLLPPPHLLVFGGERDVAPLARLGRELGWETTVVVARALSPAAAARLEAHARVLVAPPRELAGAGVELSARTAAVVATHRYLDDLAYLGELAAAGSAGDGDSPGYLAVLGPALRRERLLADLERQGHSAASGPLAALRGPAGLALGGRSPVEVALSIVAEIQAALAGGAVRPLTEAAEQVASPS